MANPLDNFKEHSLAQLRNNAAILTAELIETLPQVAYTPEATAAIAIYIEKTLPTIRNEQNTEAWVKVEAANRDKDVVISTVNVKAAERLQMHKTKKHMLAANAFYQMTKEGNVIDIALTGWSGA